MSEVKELSEEIIEKIEELSEAGNELFDEEQYHQAIEVWEKALALIPEPQQFYAESQWLEVAIGDAYFSLENYAVALSYFQKAIGNIGANGYENPFIVLRLGQCFLETNKLENAKEFLLRAYMLDGEEVFEEEDEKYFQFLKENVDLSEQ